MKATEPKKGGGGQYNWGIITESRAVKEEKKDPNYDSEEDEQGTFYKISKTVCIPPSPSR